MLGTVGCAPSIAIAVGRTVSTGYQSFMNFAGASQGQGDTAIGVVGAACDEARTRKGGGEQRDHVPSDDACFVIVTERFRQVAERDECGVVGGRRRDQIGVNHLGLRRIGG